MQLPAAGARRRGRDAAPRATCRGARRAAIATAPRPACTRCMRTTLSTPASRLRGAQLATRVPVPLALAKQWWSAMSDAQFGAADAAKAAPRGQVGQRHLQRRRAAPHPAIRGLTPRRAGFSSCRVRATDGQRSRFPCGKARAGTAIEGGRNQQAEGAIKMSLCDRPDRLQRTSPSIVPLNPPPHCIHPGKIAGRRQHSCNIPECESFPVGANRCLPSYGLAHVVVSTSSGCSFSRSRPSMYAGPSMRRVLR